MRNNIYLGAIPALSGGLTGLIAIIAMQHLGDKNLSLSSVSFLSLLFTCVTFSVIFTLGWFYISTLSAHVFKSGIEKEMAAYAAIFSAGIPASFAVLVIIKYYAALSAYSLKVVGNIYLPFSHYLHVNFAGYCFFMLLGSVIVFIAFMSALRYCVKMYQTGEPYFEKERIKHLFAAFFLFYAVTTAYVTMVYPPTGDEPHYMIIAKSLGQDLDLDLANNYADLKSIAEYYPAVLDWQNIHNTAGKDNKGVYSLHSPALPLAIAMIYKVSGRYGVQLFMNFLAALFVTLIYMLLLSYDFAPKTAMACAAITGFTSPVALNSSLVLTEIPSALLVTYALLLMSRRKSRKSMMSYFVIIGALPFFHTKLALISAGLYIYYYAQVLISREFDIRKEALNNLPLIALAGLMIVFYYIIYGKFVPFALTSIYISTSFYFILSFGNAVRSFFGMMFDRDFGLISYNWFFIVSVLGIILAAVKKEIKYLVPLMVLLPYFCIFMFWSDWGGSMAPARQLIPLMPALALCAAYFMEKASFARARVFAALVSFSILISFILTVMPFFKYSSGKEKLFAVIKVKAPALMWIFPSFSDIITPVYLMTFVYVAVITAMFFMYKRAK